MICTLFGIWCYAASSHYSGPPEWCPRPDVTAYEVAVALRYLNAVEQLVKHHPEMKRHLVEVGKCENK